MQDTQMITVNLAERWKNKQRRERSGRPFVLYEVLKIFGPCPQQQVGMASHQTWNFSHVNTCNWNKQAFWWPSDVHQGALIRLVLWAAHSHAECRVRWSCLLLCAPRSVGHTELPLEARVSAGFVRDNPQQLTDLCCLSVWVVDGNTIQTYRSVL